MKILFGVVATAALCIAACVWAPNLLYFTVPAFSLFMYLGLKENAKEENAARKRLNETDARLRRELLETHLRLIAVGVSDKKLQTSVLKLLLEAGKHLGEPVTNSRAVYETSFFEQWNQEGLDLVAQAKALLPVNPVRNLSVIATYNANPGYLYQAIKDNDEKAIHAALVGKSDTIGFVFWHSHTNPSLQGWTKEFADKCTAMGLEVSPQTIPNPDLTGHLDELYKTIVYISY